MRARSAEQHPFGGAGGLQLHDAGVAPADRLHGEEARRTAAHSAPADPATTPSSMAVAHQQRADQRRGRVDDDQGGTDRQRAGGTGATSRPQHRPAAAGARPGGVGVGCGQRRQVDVGLVGGRRQGRRPRPAARRRPGPARPARRSRAAPRPCRRALTVARPRASPAPASARAAPQARASGGPGPVSRAGGPWPRPAGVERPTSTLVVGARRRAARGSTGDVSSSSLVRAFGDHAPAVEHHHPVGQPQGRRPVGDEHGRPLGHDPRRRRRGWPPRCGRRPRRWRRRARGPGGRRGRPGPGRAAAAARPTA